VSCLHLINRSPVQGALPVCSTLVRGGDGVLFIEDGIYHCLQAELISNLPPDVELYCLREDLLARGVGSRVTETVESINYSRFVELCCEFDKVVSWF